MRHDCSTCGRSKDEPRDRTQYCNFCRHKDRINDESYWTSKDGSLIAVNIDIDSCQHEFANSNGGFKDICKKCGSLKEDVV